MADWQKFIEQIDQIAIDINLSDLSSSEDFDKLLFAFSSLSTQPDILSSSILSHAFNSGCSALNSLKTSSEKNIKEGLLSFLCSSLKAILFCLDRGQDPAEYIKTFDERLKAILNPAGNREIKTFFDLHPTEIFGFVNSANGLLDDAQEHFLALEKSSQDKAMIDNVFRVFHTLKGEANLTGLMSIAALSNEAENFLSALRLGVIKMDFEISTVFLRVIDRLRELLNDVLSDPGKAAIGEVGDFISQLQAVLSKKKEAEELIFIAQAPLLDLSRGPEILIDFILEAKEQLAQAEKLVLVLESSPNDVEAINTIFRAFHTIKGAARFLDLKDIQVYAHEAETMLDMVRKGCLHFEGQIVELLLLSIDGLGQLLEHLQQQTTNGGKIKGEYPDIAPKIAVLREVCSVKKKQPIGEILIKQGVITKGELQEALKIQKEVTGDQKLGTSLGASIRIQLEKLDSLMDLVGELVISEAQVIQCPEMLTIKQERFQSNLVELDRITRNLQELVMGMRLVQIGPVFHKMERLIRDLSKGMGKEVGVVLTGEDTEIDKNMSEIIADPLMHMIRNSLDHGIESKEERLAKGKPLIGQLELSAYHKGGFVVIEIKDDGRGLDRNKIKRKAVELGIFKMDETLSDSQIFNLIFQPGFSTADNVTEVSGRGVGMDVVRRNIDRLHGKINIFSQEDKGTVFSVLFPITLAIVDGIVVQVGHERYVLPINSVVEFIQPKESDRSLVYGKEQMYKIYDKVYPLVHLKDLFNVVGSKEKFEDQTICLLESDFGRACVVVDELLGQQQVVIKSLGEKLTDIPGVRGAAILGDGRVGLILDASSLIELAVKQGAS